MRVQGNPETHRKAMLEDEEAGKPGDSPEAPLKDAGFEETRRTIAGRAGRCRIQGDLKTHREAMQES
jgi:hypothetical protein